MSLPSLFFRLNLFLPCAQFGLRLVSTTPMRGLAELEADGCEFVENLAQPSRATCVTSRTRISTLHGTPGYKLLKSIYVVPRSSELSRSRPEGSQDAAALQFFVNSKSVLLEDGLSPQMERLQVHPHVCNKCWILPQRRGNNPADVHKFGFPLVINSLMFGRHGIGSCSYVLSMQPIHLSSNSSIFLSPLCRKSGRAPHSDAD